MMGPSHAVTGAAAWLFIAASVPTTLGMVDAVDGPALGVGMLVAAGAALLPDIDHRNGTIAHSLPPISGWAARVTERLSGGHRKGTHSLLGLVIAVAWAYLAAVIAVPVGHGNSLYLGAGIASILLCSFAIRALELVEGRLMLWIVSVVLALTVVLYGADNWVWFPAALAVGYAAHLIGDLLTVGGIPIFWPLVLKSPKWWRKVPILANVWKASGAISVPILGKSGSAREKVLIAILTTWMVWVCIFEWTGFNALGWIAPLANA